MKNFLQLEELAINKTYSSASKPESRLKRNGTVTT